MKSKYVDYSDARQKEIFGSTELLPLLPYESTVSLAMGEEQARRLGRGEMICARPELPDPRDVMRRLTELPEELCAVDVSAGCCGPIIVTVPRENAEAVMDVLYPGGLDPCYWKIIRAIEGDSFRIIGYPG